MKPCAKNQKLIAWLALDALDAPSARDLRAHLEQCAGCRQYLAELRHVSGQLAAAEPKASPPVSDTFHQTWMARVKATDKSRPSFGEALAALRQLRWRIDFVPWAALAVLCLFSLLTIRSQHLPIAATPAPVIAPTVSPAATAMAANANLSPNLANYQQAASQSLDKLDDLLFQQGNQASRAIPVCTASATVLNF